MELTSRGESWLNRGMEATPRPRNTGAIILPSVADCRKAENVKLDAADRAARLADELDDGR